VTDDNEDMITIEELNKVKVLKALRHTNGTVEIWRK